VTNQLYAAYTKALDIRNLASIIGAEELSASDQNYLKFADRFEKQFIGQGETSDRTIHNTIDLAWELLSILPKDALTRVSEAQLEKYYQTEIAT